MAESTERPANVVNIVEWLERRPAVHRPPRTVPEAVELLRTIGRPAVQAMDAIVTACATEDDVALAATTREVARKWATYSIELALARQAAGGRDA